MAAGDIAIVGFSADQKSFAFVILETFPVDTVIFFTDNGWQAAGGFRANEGIVSITIPAGTALGTVVHVTAVNTAAPVATTAGGTPLTAARTTANNLDFSQTGDQLLAYTGSAASPSFLFAIDFADSNTTWAGDATNSNTSAVPPGLTAGETALAYGPDIGSYSGPLSGTRAQILANLATAANWTFSEATAPTYPGNFTVTGGAETQSVVFNPVSDTHDEGNSGDTIYTFTVTRTGGTTGILDFSGTIAAGTTDGADFTGGVAPTTFSGSIAAGAASATVTVSVAGDTVIEGNEAFSLTLTSVSNQSGVAASIGANATATGNITNDDAVAAVPGVLSIADASVTEGNAGTSPISFTVTRASGDDGAVSATWTATFGSADASDFAAAQTFTGTVNFADGDTSETISLDVAGDTAIEGDETFTVTLSAPTGGATLDDATATGTITNNDALPANVFINEIHYDDVSTDSGEAVEIAGAAGTNLSGWSLVFYNLSDGKAYATINLSGVIPNQDDGYGTLQFAGPAAGIQNGPQDGIALVNGVGTVVQFLSYEGTVTAADGPAMGMTSTDIGVSEDPPVSDGFSLQLVGTGASYADFTWAAAMTNTFGAVNTGQDFLGSTATGLVSVRDTSVAEGNSGTTNLVFTVHRAGGLGQTASVDYAVSLTGTANAADIGAGAVFSGTVTFDPGVAAVQVTVPIQGDTDGEAHETLFITLSNPVGNITVTDASATGTILNDDGVFANIFQIQGATHTSPFLNQNVTTTGIVTAVDSNGYYLQDSGGDGNDATSDGIFIFTGGTPTVVINGQPEPILVGDFLTVTGLVTEFQATSLSLTVTQIVNSTAVRGTSANQLPNAVTIGTGGRLPPTENYENDNFTSFDPATDGLDFWESMEGMRVTIDNPLVVSETNNFGETFVVASGGAGATGVNARKGITVSEGDFNPERIQIDNDANLGPAYNPDHSQGDELGDVTGILNYAFNFYEVLVTGPVTVTNDVTLGRETTALDGDSTHLTVASYNVENLDPNDPQSKFDAIAAQIVNNLSAPDIIGLQEVQDADGTGTGQNLSGQATADKLIAAIAAAGGPTYQYLEVAPATANDTGGQDNGNIRNGYLYNPARVTYVPGSAELVEAPAYEGTRRPLAADFIFNGETITVINVHFTSRGGSEPLMGDSQPPSNAGDAARLAQAQALRAYIDGLAAGDPELNIVTLGDFNSFYFEAPLQTVQAGGAQNNLHLLLPEEERYSYMFEGNLQALDNILVGPNLNLTSEFDVVHLNAEQRAGANKPTDHDPSVAEILIVANDLISSTSGNDVRRSGAGNDTFLLYEGGNDSASGGAGSDLFVFRATMTSQDSVDGGDARDQIAIQGNYTGGNALTLGAGVVNVESFVLIPGNDTRNGDLGTGTYSYDVTTVNENVVLGQVMTFDGAQLRAGENFTFRGGAETDGSFRVVGGLGIDNFVGGSQSDVFVFNTGAFGFNDIVNGGAGTARDQLALRGDYSFLLFGSGQLISIESIVLLSGYDTPLNTDYDYTISMHDNNLIGGSMTIDAAQLRFDESLVFFGQNETDGFFRISGGAGDDQFLGGKLGDRIRGNGGSDNIYGREGADELTGGAGNDRFAYDLTTHSNAAAMDKITDFTFGDLIALETIDANSSTANDDPFTFIGSAAFTPGTPGQLRAYEVTGEPGHWFVEADVNGDAVADMVIEVYTTDLQPLDATDFTL